MIELITGGVKSGKSSYALKLALSRKQKSRFFIATAEALDEEMTERINKHKQERGNRFETIEEPLDVPESLLQLPQNSVCVIDCITLWISNLMHHKRTDLIHRLIDVLNSTSCDVIIVTNEVGMGIVPANKLARRYTELLGETNARIAEISDRVTLMISGIPVTIKGGLNNGIIR